MADHAPSPHLRVPSSEAAQPVATVVKNGGGLEVPCRFSGGGANAEGSLFGGGQVRTNVCTCVRVGRKVMLNEDSLIKWGRCGFCVCMMPHGVQAVMRVVCMMRGMYV